MLFLDRIDILADRNSKKNARTWGIEGNYLREEQQSTGNGTSTRGNLRLDPMIHRHCRKLNLFNDDLLTLGENEVNNNDVA